MVVERGGTRRTNALGWVHLAMFARYAGGNSFLSYCKYAQERVRGGRIGEFQRPIEQNVTKIVTPAVNA